MILLSLIVLCEGYIIINMKNHLKTKELINLTKGRSFGDEIHEQVYLDLKSNNNHTVYVIVSSIYMFALVMLLFTQYWLIAVLLFILRYVIYKIKNSDDSIYINYLDSITVIIVIVLGVAIL